MTTFEDRLDGQILTAAELNSYVDEIEETEAELAAHVANLSNPHATTKAQVGLSNVDNTSDADKPISSAVATALSGKAATSHTHAAADMTATGTRSASTYLRGDNTWATPTNTTYAAMTQTEAETGTATTARSIDAARLKATIIYHAPVQIGHTHVVANITDFATAVSAHADVAANTAARHTHTNQAVLNATTASFARRPSDPW